MGDSGCVVRSPTLGHHPGHPAGAAGARHSDASDVEGRCPHTFWSVCYCDTILPPPPPSQCGFFDRAKPPSDDNVSDQEQLTADQTGDA